MKLAMSRFVENKIGCILSISFYNPLGFFFFLLHTPEHVIGYICLPCQSSEEFYSDAVACFEPLVVSHSAEASEAEPTGVCVRV